MRKKQSITLSIDPGQEAKLKAIASDLDCFWGDSPSISGLLQAIAEGEIICLKKDILQSRRDIASELLTISQMIQEEAKKILLE